MCTACCARATEEAKKRTKSPFLGRRSTMDVRQVGQEVVHVQMMVRGTVRRELKRKEEASSAILSLSSFFSFLASNSHLEPNSCRLALFSEQKEPWSCHRHDGKKTGPLVVETGNSSTSDGR